MRLHYLTVPALAVLAVTGSAHAQSPFPRGGLLLHGNYCGPGNRAPLPPIDVLDAACARHDACSPGRGRPASAACNDRLRREAEAIANDPRQPSELRGTAGFIAFGASLLPSAPGIAPYPAYAYRQGPIPLPPVAEEFDEKDE